MQYNAVRIFLSIKNPLTGDHLSNTFTVPDDMEATVNNFEIFRESNPDSYVTIIYIRPGQMPIVLSKLPLNMEEEAAQVSDGKMSPEDFMTNWYSERGAVAFAEPEYDGEPDWNNIAQDMAEVEWYGDGNV